MNRVDFMNQLESLLQSISLTEREEAIQYYNDYFDDAGEENEQEVIEALGNPARVAENIKRDLAGNGYGEAARKVKASDRVLMEYGKDIPEDSEEPEKAGQQDKERDGNSGSKAPSAEANTFEPKDGSGRQAASGAHSQGSGNATFGYGQGSGNVSSEYGRRGENTSSGYGQGSNSSFESGSSGGQSQNATGSGSWGQNASESGSSSSWNQNATGNGSSGSWNQNATGSGSSSSWNQNTTGSGSSGNWSQNAAGSSSSGSWSQNTSGNRWDQGASGYSEYKPEKRKKGESMPAWAIAMLVTILVIASPVLASVALGIACVVIGGIVGWFSMILGVGVAAVVLLVMMVVLAVVGVMCMFVSPWAGTALLGGALLCGGIGLLCLMLTVAMAGIATPAIFRGIAFVFRGFKRKRAKVKWTGGVAE